MMHPSVTRAISSVDLRKPLKAALHAIGVLTQENLELRKEIKLRDEMLTELQEMIGRLS